MIGHVPGDHSYGVEALKALTNFSKVKASHSMQWNWNTRLDVTVVVKRLMGCVDGC